MLQGYQTKTNPKESQLLQQKDVQHLQMDIRLVPNLRSAPVYGQVELVQFGQMRQERSSPAQKLCSTVRSGKLTLFLKNPPVQQNFFVSASETKTFA